MPPVYVFGIMLFLLLASGVSLGLMLFFRPKQTSLSSTAEPTSPAIEEPTSPAIEEPAKPNPVVGPKKGALVIMGGGADSLSPTPPKTNFEYIFAKFVELAGGEEARIVVVSSIPKSNPLAFREAKNLNVAEVTLRYTDDPDLANTWGFVQPITTATGIWFLGGRQWRYAQAYDGTLAEKEFSNVLERGGVIGGTSAGASIQGSFLVRGDTSSAAIMVGDEQRGFGYMRNTAIDQHVVARGREQGLIEVLEDPENKMWEEFDRAALLGIGIDEDVAIVVQGDRFEVIGKKNGTVLVYDPKKWNAETPDKEKWVTLRTGNSYDLKKRNVL